MNSKTTNSKAMMRTTVNSTTMIMSGPIMGSTATISKAIMRQHDREQAIMNARS